MDDKVIKRNLRYKNNMALLACLEGYVVPTDGFDLDTFVNYCRIVKYCKDWMLLSHIDESIPLHYDFGYYGKHPTDKENNLYLVMEKEFTLTSRILIGNIVRKYNIPKLQEGDLKLFPKEKVDKEIFTK